MNISKKLALLALAGSVGVGAIVLQATPAEAFENNTRMKECGFHWTSWYAVVSIYEPCPLPPPHSHNSGNNGGSGGSGGGQSGPECITVREIFDPQLPPS